MRPFVTTVTSVTGHFLYIDPSRARMRAYTCTHTGDTGDRPMNMGLSVVTSTPNHSPLKW